MVQTHSTILNTWASALLFPHTLTPSLNFHRDRTKLAFGPCTNKKLITGYAGRTSQFSSAQLSSPTHQFTPSQLPTDMLSFVSISMNMWSGFNLPARLLMFWYITDRHSWSRWMENMILRGECRIFRTISHTFFSKFGWSSNIYFEATYCIHIYRSCHLWPQGGTVHITWLRRPRHHFGEETFWF